MTKADSEVSAAQGSGPLGGVRVVELAGIGPAPMCCMLLADLGAEVVRVERLGAASGAFVPSRFDLLARGRRSVALDLKRPEAVEAVRRLAGQADVFVEGFRPGVAEKLGLGPVDLCARNPRLVYGRMTGWGQDGPLASAAGHDIGYLAITGALDAIGRAGQPPSVPLNLVADFGGGALYLATGILAALVERQRSGQGQVVDAAMVDGVVHLLTMFQGFRAAGMWPNGRGRNLLDGGAPFYDVYECSDGRFVAVGPLEPRFFAVLADGLGLSAEDRARHLDVSEWPALRASLAAAFRTRPRDEWAARFEGSDACLSPVLTLDEAPAHPHNAARANHVVVDGIVQSAPAPRFSRTPAAPVAPVPVPGSDTRDALAAWGFTDADLAALSAAGAIR